MQHKTRLGFAAALTIVLLRLAIGYHFYKEGETKIRDGSFSSAGFFRQAKGELAPFFRGLLADEDARFRLCYAPEQPDGTDPTVTFEYWEDLGGDVAARCRLLIDDLETRRKTLKAEIDRRRSQGEDVGVLEKQYKEDEQKILRLREHIENIGPILRRHMDEFELFLTAYEDDIRKYFRSLDRLDGFQRDGENRKEVAEEVESLSGQQAKIYGDIMKDRAPLIAQVESAWNAVEDELNDVGVEEYESEGFEQLERPYVKRPLMAWVDKIVPWHHVIVGGLIFFGLLCRPASLLAAFFLLLICACQLPWAPGALPTYYQIVEMLALLCLAAVGAGRYGGLDYFIEYFAGSRESNREGEPNESHA